MIDDCADAYCGLTVNNCSVHWIVCKCIWCMGLNNCITSYIELNFILTSWSCADCLS